MPYAARLRCLPDIAWGRGRARPSCDLGRYCTGTGVPTPHDLWPLLLPFPVLMQLPPACSCSSRSFRRWGVVPAVWTLVLRDWAVVGDRPVGVYGGLVSAMALTFVVVVVVVGGGV
jgi:hypothetical protein